MLEANNDLQWLNSLRDAEALTELLKCCGSQRWAFSMAKARPFENFDQLSNKASEEWWQLPHEDWLEAFRSHPKIGEKNAAAEVSNQSHKWSGQEQSGVKNSSSETLHDLARFNREYEAKFGYIFIVCATGKSSEEMLSLLRSRLRNDPEVELLIAAAEQEKITQLRLRKLIA